MRYHVCAWGSTEHPDLDEIMDHVPKDLSFKYPYVDVANLIPIPLEAIKKAMDGI